MERQQLSKSKRIFIRKEKARIRKHIFNKAEQEKQIGALYEKLSVGSADLGQKRAVKNTVTEK